MSYSHGDTVIAIGARLQFLPINRLSFICFYFDSISGPNSSKIGNISVEKCLANITICRKSHMIIQLSFLPVSMKTLWSCRLIESVNSCEQNCYDDPRRVRDFVHADCFGGGGGGRVILLCF